MDCGSCEEVRNYHCEICDGNSPWTSS